MKVILKRSVKVFGHVIPSNVELNVYVMDGDKYAQHPIHKELFRGITEKNIKTLIED
jgi:hypothetical protein